MAGAACDMICILAHGIAKPSRSPPERDASMGDRMSNMPDSGSRMFPPRWFWIPLRVLAVTLVLTFLSFAISLLLGIIGLLIGARLRGVSPDMPFAYRYVALPAAGVVGAIVLVSSAFMEIRHFRQSQALAAIERAR
jgi:TRAP-type C4-dicarboxylate transport system permease small subunit